MVKIVTFDPVPRGYNPCNIFYFANTPFKPGDNTLVDIVFDNITAHPDWDDYISDGTFTTSEIVTNLIPFFASPYTGVIESDIDASQVLQNTLDIQQLQLQAHDPVTPTDASLIENGVVDQEFRVQLDTITPNNILQVTAAGLYATFKLSWSWSASRRASLSTPSALRGPDGVPTSINPFISYYDATIRKIIVANATNDLNQWEGVVIVNGIEVYTLIKTAGNDYIVSPDLNIVIDQGDKVVLCFRDNTTAIQNPTIHVLLSEN